MLGFSRWAHAAAQTAEVMEDSVDVPRGRALWVSRGQFGEVGLLMFFITSNGACFKLSIMKPQNSMRRDTLVPHCYFGEIGY